MNNILRVNMTDLSVKTKALPKKYQTFGGRALTSNIVSDEVPADCHPLGPSNKLVFAPGIVTGTAAPTSARISVGGKGALTGTIKEANAGTKFSPMLHRLGYAAIIVEGMPKDSSKRYLLEINKDGAKLLPADDLKGKVGSATVSALLAKYGKKTLGICFNGPAGEMLMTMAGIGFNDMENRATRYAGRGGLGAVLGSKGLKAIVVDSEGAPSSIPIADPELFKVGQKKLVSALQTHALTKPGGALNAYGTDVLINVLNEAGGLPTRNFSSGRFEGAAKVSGEALAEGIKTRGAGMMGHNCSPGCIIKCSNVWPKLDKTEAASCMEYESVWALGPNCGIDDLDQIAEMVTLCNELGLDTIEAGVTLGVAMEGGLAKFGDGKAAIALLKEIGNGSPTGRILGQGAGFTGQALGVKRVPVVKNQAIPAYDPRAVKGMGVTYATNPQGGDHTIGYAVAPEILSVGGKADPLSPTGKADISRNLQIATAVLDSTGYCLFIAFAILDIADGFLGMVDTVNGVLGTKMTPADITAYGVKLLKLEKAFTNRAGISKYADRIPEFMKLEALPPHNVVFDVTDAELDSVYDKM
jgi:aldehyde:ferredoxin oxidoreductase